MDEIHDLPLANRLVDDIIRKWLDTAAAIALATNTDPEFRKGVDQMRYLHLDNYWYTITPKIIDALQRANVAVTD